MVRACVLMMAVLGAGAVAQDAAVLVEREAVPAEENAAFQYWHGWWSLAEYMEIARGANYTPDGLVVRAGSPIEEVERAIATASLVVDSLIHASKMEKCDFGSRAEQSFDGSVLFQDPHLAPARDSANLLALVSGKLYLKGDSEKATERLATIFRMAEHVGRDRTLVSCLVGASIFEIGTNYAERFQNHMTEQDRAVIFESLRLYPSDDPFRFRVTVLNDARAASQGLRDQITSGQFDPDMFSVSTNSIVDMLGREMESALGNSKAARLARARLVRDASRLSDLGQALYEAWDDTNAFEELSREAASGEYGVFAPFMTGPYTRVRTNGFESRVKLNALRAWASGETETLELPEEEN